MPQNNVSFCSSGTCGTLSDPARPPATARGGTPAILARTAGLALIALAIAPHAGCAGRAQLDRAMAQVIEEQSLRLREDILAPRPPQADLGLRTPHGTPHGADRASLLSKAPATANPTASELSFTPASEERDVAARLRALGAQSGLGAAEGDAAIVAAEGARVLTLVDALRTAQQRAPEFLAAQEDYLLAVIRLLIERHQWSPRFFNDTTVALAGDGADGQFTPALNLINSLRATQRLPSGGSVEARWVWNASEQLRQSAGGEYVSSSSLVLSGNVPLLRGAGWVAREDLIQAERDLVYQARTFERVRRTLLVDIAQDYFGLLQTRASIANQARQLASLRQFAQATKARADAGRIEAFQTFITESRVQTAEQSLASLRERYILQLDRFQVRLGMDTTEPLDLSEDVLALGEPAIDLEDATRLALSYRLDLQNSKDRLEDRRRDVLSAQDNTRADLNLTGSLTVPTDPGNQNAVTDFQGGDSDYRVGATLSLPLDRRTERLNVTSAQIRLQRATRDHETLRDRIAVDVRSAVRNVELARFQLNLAEQQVEINRKRLRGQQLQQDTVSPQAIIDTENELLDAENRRDAARTSLRTAVLNYLLASDQLRVDREGLLAPLPGMMAAPPAQAPDQAPDQTPDQTTSPATDQSPSPPAP